MIKDKQMTEKSADFNAVLDAIKNGVVTTSVWPGRKPDELFTTLNTAEGADQKIEGFTLRLASGDSAGFNIETDISFIFHINFNNELINYIEINTHKGDPSSFAASLDIGWDQMCQLLSTKINEQIIEAVLSA